MNEDKKIEQYLINFRFTIGSILVLLIALGGGIISSLRNDMFDIFLILGIILFDFAILILVFFVSKLYFMTKEL